MATTAAITPHAFDEQQTIQKPGIPTLHHLNHSQSQKIFWLLEELGVEYNHVAYYRAQGRAPPELAKIHMLGKSPTFVNKDGRVMVESSVIISYLIDTYDHDHKFAATDQIRSDEISSFVASSMGPVSTIELFVEILCIHTPWPFSYITRGIRSKLQNVFTTGEFKKALSYLEGELGDEEWLNGKHPGKSDFMTTFPVDMIVERKWLDVAKDFPKLAAWRNRVRERPAWKRAIEKGNGYDLTKCDE